MSDIGGRASEDEEDDGGAAAEEDEEDDDEADVSLSRLGNRFTASAASSTTSFCFLWDKRLHAVGLGQHCGQYRPDTHPL